jgi:wyosine [tRNA(Phe)-imidazoG37] synthetase (radical SAM superfamily)
MPLDTSDHDRSSAGLTYVYPVVSRRSGGVSVGVNLNPNKACNWRCIYCQVPGLVRGKGPEIDLDLLERELAGLLREARTDEWLARNAPEGARALRDVALSGDGEATSSPSFAGAVDCIGRVMARLSLELPVVLITNGSLVHVPEVQRGIASLARLGGRVWFKLDSATHAGMLAINSSRAGPERARANLATCARLCPTWIQTCLFRRRGQAPSAEEQAAFLAFLRDALADGVALRGVQLYSLARPSHQPEAPELAPLSEEWLTAFGQRVAQLGLPVSVHP